MPMVKGQANKNCLVFTTSSCVTMRAGRQTETDRICTHCGDRLLRVAVCHWTKKVFANRLEDTFVFGSGGGVGAVRYLRHCSDGGGLQISFAFHLQHYGVSGSAGLKHMTHYPQSDANQLFSKGWFGWIKCGNKSRHVGDCAASATGLPQRDIRFTPGRL